MKKLLFCIAAILLVTFAQAQKIKGTVKGILQDSLTQQPMADATVSVASSKDSSLVSFTLTSNSGYFEVKNLEAGDYYIMVTYQGFENLKKSFTVNDSIPVMDFAAINMARSYKTLDEVVVQDAPVKVKGDTVSFNANYFKTTKPNATAEDLLKRLPGMQVEKDGTVKAQGETVQKIYVDGKEFFSNDPKLATKNLTADMIESVEMYDDMSDQAKFSGVDDGSRTKAINLKLKKDKKKGMFGRASAGYGTDDRYEGALSANYFKGATKLSVIARANNTNNLGFTNQDNIGFSNMGNVTMGSRGNTVNNGGNGITKNWTAGTNYSDLWGKKTEITGSYFYNNTNNKNMSSSYRQTTFKDSVVNRSQQANADNTNGNHRINLRLTVNIDSMSSLIYTPNISFQNSKSTRVDTTESFQVKDGLTSKVSDSRAWRNNIGDNMNWNNNLTYRRKFAKRGRLFSISLNNTYSTTDRDGYTISANRVYKNDTLRRNTQVNQKSIQDNSTNNYGVTVSYVEPLARDKMVELNYSHNKNQNESDREVYDWNTATGDFDKKNNQLTNLFQNLNESNRIGANYRVVKKKYNYQAGLAVQNMLLQSDNKTKDSLVRQRFTNLFPTAAFTYQFARSKNLRFNYRGRTNQPGVNQLQEILDNSNPLYWTIGNASLKQEYSNNFSINYSSFDMVKFRNFFANVNFSNTYNKIVNNVITGGKFYDKIFIEPGSQLTVPVNTDGAFNVNSFFNVGFPIKGLKGGNINTSTQANYNRGVSFADSIKNYNKNLNLGQTLRISYLYKEKLDVAFGGNVNYNSVKNTLQKSSNQNTHYYTYAASVDASYTFPKNFILSTDVDYTTNTGLAAGYNQSFTLWNASLSKRMLANNRGELKFFVFDILKQNRSISRNFNDNYIEDVQNTVMQRYFMLSFTYNLNRMGATGNAGTRGGNNNGRRSGNMN